MAKAKISQEEVNEVCNHLLNVEQTEPQIRNVRAMLGAGSNSTISRMLDHWSQSRPKTNIESEALDPTIVKAINNLVSTLVNNGLSNIRNDYQRITEDKNDALAENSRLGDTIKEQEIMLINMREMNAELKVRIELLQQSHEFLETELKARSNQLINAEKELGQITSEYSSTLEKLMAYESKEAEFLKMRDQLTTVQGQLKTQRQLEELLQQTHH
jgi:chromosome segregation ATPase